MLLHRRIIKGQKYDMEHICTDTKQNSLKSAGRGGRIGSSALRVSIEQSHDFTGLEQNVNRYDLLLLVKRTGKHMGFSPRMIALLDYYMSFTRNIDWEEGSSPIIYQSLSKTALDIGVSERQVQRLEQSLFDIGALTWNDSGNHRRYGRRDGKSGQILYAYGVDLTPLAYLKPMLESKLQEKRLYDAAWMETKRQISWHRSQIRAVIAEMDVATAEEQRDYSDEMTTLQRSYAAIAAQIRTHLSLPTLRELLVSHQELYKHAVSLIDPCSAAITSQETNKMSSKNDTDVIDYNSTIKKQSNKLDTNRAHAQCFQKSSNDSVLDKIQPSQLTQDSSEVGEGTDQKKDQTDEADNLILKTGLQHITLKQALNASSEKFRDHMPIEPRPMNWNDFIEAAYRMREELCISQSSWARACAILGRSGAAISLLLTDQAQQREHNPVAKTGAYFNAMINRAKSGELNLHNSIFGILKKEFGGGEQ